MTDDFLSAFLGTPTEGEEQIALPTSEGLGTGFVGPVSAAVLWSFWDADKLDPEQWKAEDGDRRGFTSRGREGSWFYYFEDRTEAMAAQEYLGAYAPRQVWRFEVPTSRVLNFYQTNPEDTWGENVSGDVRIVTLRSKYRHEFHMMALPSIVQALAVQAGLLEEPLFTLEELQAATQYTDEFQIRVVGNNTENYADSELWKARVALWAALGEDDPTAYSPKDRGTKYDTTSDKLSALLRVVTVPWKQPIWARMQLIPDPRLDATYQASDGHTVRLNIPVVTEVFRDEAHAKEVVEAEKGPGGSAPAAQAKKADTPEAPEDWAGYESEFAIELGKKKAEFDGKMPPPPKVAEIAESLSCTVVNVREWWPLV